LGTTHRYLAILATLSLVIVLGAPGPWAAPSAVARPAASEVAAGKKKAQSPGAPAPASPAATTRTGGLSTGDKLAIGIALLIAASLLVRELADF
jgi:hypothetical protein